MWMLLLRGTGKRARRPLRAAREVTPLDRARSKHHAAHLTSRADPRASSSPARCRSEVVRGGRRARRRAPSPPPPRRCVRRGPRRPREEQGCEQRRHAHDEPRPPALDHRLVCLRERPAERDAHARVPDGSCAATRTRRGPRPARRAPPRRPSSGPCADRAERHVLREGSNSAVVGEQPGVEDTRPPRRTSTPRRSRPAQEAAARRTGKRPSVTQTAIPPPEHRQRAAPLAQELGGEPRRGGPAATATADGSPLPAHGAQFACTWTRSPARSPSTARDTIAPTRPDRTARTPGRTR